MGKLGFERGTSDSKTLIFNTAHAEGDKEQKLKYGMEKRAGTKA